VSCVGRVNVFYHSIEIEGCGDINFDMQHRVWYVGGVARILLTSKSVWLWEWIADVCFCLVEWVIVRFGHCDGVV